MLSNGQKARQKIRNTVKKLELENAVRTVLQVNNKSSLLLRRDKFFQVDSAVELLSTHPEYPFPWATFLYFS